MDSPNLEIIRFVRAGAAGEVVSASLISWMDGVGSVNHPSQVATWNSRSSNFVAGFVHG